VENLHDLEALILKEEIRQNSVRVLTARANGSMYISELWSKKQYDKVKSESGLGKVINNTKRLNWVTNEQSTNLKETKLKKKILRFKKPAQDEYNLQNVNTLMDYGFKVIK
jgi:hypothetical protein